MSSSDMVDSFIASDVSNETKLMEDEVLLPLLDELSRIEDYDISTFTRALLLKASSFWEAPSSHKHEYYPPDEMLAGGLVTHTKRVFRVVEILGILYELESIEIDKLKSAALLHDVTKIATITDDGVPVYDYLHPYTLDALYLSVRHDDELNTGASQSNVLSISDDVVEHILKAIRAHRGKQSPIPETYPQKNSLTMLLHVANEIAKSLHYFIDGERVILERWLEMSGE